MAAAVKFLMIAALLQMGASVPAPEPDPHNNIDIQVIQEVNSVCGNGGCPPKPEISEDTWPWLWSGCWWFSYGEVVWYPTWSIITIDCWEYICFGGVWFPGNSVNPECGNCTFGGEPLVYPFDKLKISGIGALAQYTNVINVNVPGDYVMAQPGFVVSNAPGLTRPAEFGVNSRFISTWPADQIDCVIYYEADISIEMCLIRVGMIHELPKLVTVKQGAPPGTPLSVTINAIGLVKLGGSILVFKRPFVIGGGMNCIIVIGSQGLTVALCTHSMSGGYMPWAYIYAVPGLQSTTSTLYGLCNTWTGVNQTCFIAQNKTCVKDWQDGDNGNGVPILNDDLVETWKVPPYPTTGTTSSTTNVT